ncbi:glycosyltransferase family 4 protein [Bacteroides sp.]|uniref:glycosyltransferase family 4 protein n=1 Tax=Bacteroides sp. TaxID=29523 RepID=UPI0025C2E889|nr:glycosyltransferase family 4 protein [Bacteroides sp.]
MKKIRIAYCIPALYYPSGMERVLILKANYLACHGYEVHIILTDGGDKPPYFPLDPSVRLHQLDIDFEEPYRYVFPLRVWLYRVRMRILKKKLNECLCALKPDITVSLLRRDINVINRMTDGSLKMGEIHFDRMHYRNFNVSWLPSRLNACIERRWMNSLIQELRQLSKFVVLTHEDAAFWPELQNVHVIPNPVPFFPDTVSDCSNKQVIAMGRYVAQKGFDRLISAWRMVVDRHPDWTLRIYGDGHLRERLQLQVEDLKLTDSCFLERSISDVVSKFCESSISVLSSRFEGFGLVIVEAMSCGIPVVAYTCHCGPRDIITDGKDGILVSEGDIAGLAEGISRLIEDEELRRKMGKEARRRAADYRMEVIGAQWIELFESLLSRPVQDEGN